MFFKRVIKIRPFPASYPQQIYILLLWPLIYCWYFTYLAYAAGRETTASFLRAHNTAAALNCLREKDVFFALKSLAAGYAVGPSCTQTGHHLLKATLLGRREPLLCDDKPSDER